MNKVDNLLKTPFSSLTLEQKLEITRLGADQPSNFSFTQSNNTGGRTCQGIFEKKTWLTPSIEKQSLFCFYCLLFGGDGLWTKTGNRDRNQLYIQINRHEMSALHLENACKFKTFGIAQLDNAVGVLIVKHDELVKKNRHVLGRVIDCLKFCGTHELALRGNNETEVLSNRGNVFDLLSLLGYDHLNNASVNEYTVQNELLDCMYSVYIEELIKDVNAADFVSVQADEATDITCRSQCVIILRFIKDNKPVERFFSFQEVLDRTASGLADVLKKSLEPFKLEEKLIAQAYNGAAAISDIEMFMQDTFPYATYVHCYAHQLDLVIKNACSENIRSVKLFFANITGFSTFVSSPKHSDLLRSVCQKHNMPAISATRWNFQFRVVHSVKEHREELIELFEKIEEEEGWDDLTVREAFGLKRLLKNEEFVFFLNFFYDIMKHVDILYNTIHMQSSTRIIVENAIQHFTSVVSEIRMNTDNYRCQGYDGNVSLSSRNGEDNLNANAMEVCDIITNHLRERFQNSHIFGSFSILDPKKFTSFRQVFPIEQVNTFASNYVTFICKDKLINELKVIYHNDTFKNMTSVCSLYSFFIQHKFQDSFSEVHKALQIAITTPVTTTESERSFSTVERIKAFLRNTKGQDQDRLDPLAVCSIHEDEISEISNFNNRVIDIFATQKHRRAHLLFT